MPTLSYRVFAASAAVAVVAIVLSIVMFADVRGCSTREDVTARVSAVSSQLQQAAAQGKLKLEELAAGIKQVNDAATAYETTKDAQAYCEALDSLNIPATD
jgi:hypothetical protein